MISQRLSLALLSSLALCLAACGNVGTYVWVRELRTENATAPETEYLVRDGDVLNVRVFNQEPMSTRARVRSDGRIAMPVLGDVDVRGKRPSSLKAELEARMKDIVNAPSVTVTIEEFQPITVFALGEVGHPGSFPVDPRATIAQVLAVAGGLTDFASRDRIFVVRRAPQTLRVRFTYEDITRGDPHSTAFAFRQGDLVVVE
jgi:polysaccharide export outer membrane protein